MIQPRATGNATRLVALLLLLHPVLPAVAGLEDFKRETQKEEQRKGNSKGDSGNSAGSVVFGTIASVFAALWYDWNNAVHYDDYPYAHQRPMVERNPPDFAPEDPVREKQNRTFWNLEAAGQIQESSTRAGSLAFAGRFTPVFGVFARYRQFFEGGVQSLHDSRLGFEVALLQFSSMQLSAQLAYVNFSGLLERSGASPALDLLFFPGKPVVFGVSVGTVQFPQITYLELRPRFGILISRWELFIAGYLLSADSAYLRGIETGARVWF